MYHRTRNPGPKRRNLDRAGFSCGGGCRARPGPSEPPGRTDVSSITARSMAGRPSQGTLVLLTRRACWGHRTAGHAAVPRDRSRSSKTPFRTGLRAARNITWAQLAKSPVTDSQPHHSLCPYSILNLFIVVKTYSEKKPICAGISKNIRN